MKHISSNNTSKGKVMTMLEHQNYMLEKGKTKNIGFFESVSLKIAGRSDGAHGLPRQDGGGEWISPMLSKEIHSYKEFCDRIWGKLQIDISDKFARLGYLLDNLKSLEGQLEEARGRLEKAQSIGEPDYHIKKRGEEHLSENQVVSRRKRYHQKQLQPFMSSVQSLGNELKENLKEAILLENEITEANNAARLICERVMNHTRQRMDVYWNASYASHPKKNNLPVTPGIRLIPDAELMYFRQHKQFLDKAEETIDYLKVKYDVTTEKEEKKYE